MRVMNYARPLRLMMLSFAVWQDDGEPQGIGVCLVKGDSFFRGALERSNIYAAPVNTALGAYTLTAIPCREPEEAEAMRTVFGEPKHQH